MGMAKNPSANWQKLGATLDAAINYKPCNILHIEQDLSQPECATSIGPISGIWRLHESIAPHKNCNPIQRFPRRLNV